MRARSGFTLIEMLVVLVVAGLLIAMASMNFGTLISRLKGSSEARDIHGTLSEARLDALTRNRRTGVVMDLRHRRILMFVDSTTDGLYTENSRDLVLRGWQQLDSSGTLVARLASNSSGGGTYAHVVFETDGSTSAQLRLVSKTNGDSTTVQIVPVTGMAMVVHK